MPDWNDLQHYNVPKWLRDAKFAIYTHWGVYSVPACGPNASWYPYNMYRKGTPQYEYHVKHYGLPENFGYKDFIPQFTGEKFDANEWAALFKAAGARIAGPVGEHHDGFTMWDSAYTKWNAKNMGPKRDVVGELEKAIKGQGMKFMTAMHHAENWWFYPHWKTEYDVADPLYAGLYGNSHNEEWIGRGEELDANPLYQNQHVFWPVQQKPSKEFLDLWLNKLKELEDKYEPDLIWFDFGLKWIKEEYKKEFISYYYEKARKQNREVAITYKWNDLVPGCGVEDIEQGRKSELSYSFWVTDTTVDAGEAWGYIYNNSYKSVKELIHYLVDNVSKNGALLLNVGPKSDGSIPEEAKQILLEIGEWLAINGEAIYDTVPWICAGEGPTNAGKSGAFNEYALDYTSEDFRFTAKNNNLYAICMAKPGETVCIKSIGEFVYEDEIVSVHMLGVEDELEFKYTYRGLQIKCPENLPGDHAYSFKITRKAD